MICLIKMKKTINTQTYHSPCGDLLLGSFEGKLCLCDWMAEEHRLLADRRLERSLNAEMTDIPSEITAKAAQELDEYFAGRRETGRPRFYTSIFLTGVFSFEPSGENRVRGKYQLASLLNQLPFNQSLLYSCNI